MTDHGHQNLDAHTGIMIDGPDTPDRDDAIWVRSDGTGFDAWAHIARIGDELPIGGPGDIRARKRMHSRYFADHTDKMLPSEVEAAASLRADARCATVYVRMRFNLDAELVDTTVGAGRLDRSWALSYTDAAAALRDPDSAFHDRLTTAHRLANALLRRRQSSGALAFYDLFKGFATNEEGQLVRLGAEQRNAGYVIVQEFMIAANSAIAMWCAARDLPILYRNHRAAAVAGDRDELLAELSAAEARADTGGYQLLRRRMGVVQRPATYNPTVFGHYGLNLPAYAHTTSPLRRYSDLINQRILIAASEDRPSPYDFDALETISTDLNRRLQAERERRADRHKTAARKTTASQLEAAEFTGLAPAAFSKVLRMALGQDDPSAPVIAEAGRRFTDDTLPLRDACEILIPARGPAWDPLRQRIHEHLAAEPNHALTVISMYAQSIVGGPVGESHMRWDYTSVGAPNQPCFEARLNLELGDRRHESPIRRASSKKDAKAQVAVALLAQLDGLPDLSRNAERPEITTAKTDRTKVPADRNPAMAINEYAQRGIITGPEWEYHHDGPPHEPVYTCHAHTVVDGVTLQATGTGPGKQPAKLAAAKALRSAIEEHLDTAEMTGTP